MSTIYQLTLTATDTGEIGKQLHYGSTPAEILEWAENTFAGHYDRITVEPYRP